MQPLAEEKHYYTKRTLLYLMNHALVVAGCKKGDRQSQKLLFEQYSKGLLLLCKRYVQNNHDAEELLLNGFYKFYSTVKTFEYIDEPNLHGWLKRIVINECLMHLRKNKGVQFVPGTAETDVPLNEDILGNMNAKAILDCIAQIPGGYRVVFNLYIIEGYSHKEIGAMLGIAEGTSKSQLVRAKIYLQKVLEKNGIVYETE